MKMQAPPAVEKQGYLHRNNKRQSRLRSNLFYHELHGFVKQKGKEYA